jgi:methionine--tRNA ligase beta chain
LKVGKIKNVENLKGYNKILKIVVDLGNETREIMSGISKYYSSEDLINKSVIVCTNLEPKRFGEHISNGMVLAADNNDRPVLLTVFEEVEPGSDVT